MKYLYLNLLFLCFIISCDNNKSINESNLFLEESIKVYQYDSFDPLKIELSLELANKALELYDHNIGALSRKSSLLFIKRDIGPLLQNAKKLVEYSPDIPRFQSDLALYYELNNEFGKSKGYYQKSIELYSRLIQKEPTDFNLRIEYINLLGFVNNTNAASKAFAEMKEMSWNENQSKFLERYKLMPGQKQLLLKYWNGDIDFDEYTELLNQYN